MARLALDEDGAAGALEASLVVSPLPGSRVVRLSFEGPFVEGRRGARWFAEHHALARLLSLQQNEVVHAYSYDPVATESVATYGNGKRVGGERLSYADAELPDDEGEFSDRAFRALQAKWPLGHLAQVMGFTRAAFERLPRLPQSVWDIATGQPLAEAAPLSRIA